MKKVDADGKVIKRDPDLVNSEAALKRASHRARELARRSVGYVVIYRDGQVVEEHLDKQMA